MSQSIKILAIIFSLLFLAACTTTTANKKPGSIHGETPIIKTSDVIEEGKKDMEEKVRIGPKPYNTDFDPTVNKRKTITSEKVRNYITIPDDFVKLKQQVNINFNGVDFKDAMAAMADLGGINILVGEEVSGTVTAKLDNVGWDIAFQTILDMKTLGADTDVAKGIIRIHTPEKLTAQETVKSTRAEALKKKIQLEDTVEPVLAEIFKLHYISPLQAKTTLENLFKAQSGTAGTEAVISSISNVTITEESMTRSIIVRGRKPDLDVIDSVLKNIDIRTQQVLIEAFIVEAKSDFAKALGAKVGAMSKSDRGPEQTTISGITGGGNAATTSAGITLGAIAGTMSNQGITGGTSGIGILRQIGARALKIELEALESLALSRTLSQPSVFTLNNQIATVTQGVQIPYQTTSDGTTTTQFKEAALSLVVTPSIIGDGNVLLDIKVNNDSPTTVSNSTEPAITTNQIVTKLLIGDGDIVVIGGIKKNINTDKRSGTPGVSKVPGIGNLFKSTSDTDVLTELLVFIAPRVIN